MRELEHRSIRRAWRTPLAVALAGIAVVACDDEPSPVRDGGAGASGDAAPPADAAGVAQDARATDVGDAASPPAALVDYDPISYALATVGKTFNMEAQVPPPCYTKTGSASNPCWACHTRGAAPNYLDDCELQSSYSFSDFASTNRWTNLFVSRETARAQIDDADILAWVRQDNYRPLRAAIERRAATGAYVGWVPDLDFDAGFDEDGFARDGSGWRAFRYKPFLGTFWPTNGSTDDVLVRLPPSFRVDAQGRPSRATYKRNLEILEHAIAHAPERRTPLPATFEGGAVGVRVTRYLYPEGTEFLHTVRYLDPDAPNMLARRMKEVRYSRKVRFLEPSVLLRVHETEVDAKDRGVLAQYAGSPEVGYRNDYGWQLQGYIEDRDGRLRLQTEEEHRFCLGCHGNLGVTVDRTFAFARKVPGASGWAYQDLRGMADVPQAGSTRPEYLTYLERVAGGDEFRANDEIRARLFPNGVLDEAAVRRAGPGGDRDLTALVLPSYRRALELDKAYRLLVEAQSFDRGRDAVLTAPENVHREIDNGTSDLGAASASHCDGRLWLDW